MKRALVCGAGGFIAGHLAKKLKREGYWVRVVDVKHREFVPTQADEFLLLDRRNPRELPPQAAPSWLSPCAGSRPTRAAKEPGGNPR
jgi:nucleoside-diphosphate-sugar epimerase